MSAILNNKSPNDQSQIQPNRKDPQEQEVQLVKDKENDLNFASSEPALTKGPSTLKKIAVVAVFAILMATPALAMVVAVPLASRNIRFFTDSKPLHNVESYISYTKVLSTSNITLLQEYEPIAPTLFAQTIQYTQNSQGSNEEIAGISDAPKQIIGIEYKDCRPLTRQLTDSIVAVTRTAMNTMSKIPSAIKDWLGRVHPYRIDPLKALPAWKKESSGLYVMVHGLNGHPSIWDSYSDHIKTAHQNADQAIVIVPKAGNCPQKEASDPIVALVMDYTKKHPGKPIALIGTSNGARLVAYIETKLRIASPKTPVLVSSIAGVHHGSWVMNIVHEYGLSNFFGYGPEIMHELKHASPIVQETLQAQRAQLKEGTIRDFSFYMTTEETHIHPPTSELPIINQNERHYVVHAEGHSSIVERVREDLLAHATQWMKNQITVSVE